MELSQKIQSFNSLCLSLQNSIKFAKEHLKKQEDKSTDLTHELELENTTYIQRAKIASKMRRVLRERRKYKNEIEVGEPLVKLINSPEGKAFLKKLEQVLGDTRKIEDYHKNRSYKKRCFDESQV